MTLGDIRPILLGGVDRLILEIFRCYSAVHTANLRQSMPNKLLNSNSVASGCCVTNSAS